MSPRKPKAQQGIQSIEVGGRLLRSLAEARQPQMLRDLAAAAGMPAAKAHRYLVSLVRMGLAEQHVESGRYDLGAFALELGLSALGRLEPVAIAARTLLELQAETGQTVALAVWGNHGATIVRWLGADTPVAATLRVGSVMPLTRSATGGAFLAFLPRETTNDIVRNELAEQARKGLSPATRAQVERVIAQTRKRGFASTSDFIPGIAGIAAPVFDGAGSMVLALIALGYSKPFEAASARLSAAVLRKARELSQRLGWRPAAKVHT
jgi:DNA-binding IclR family transcriptional regulator